MPESLSVKSASPGKGSLRETAVRWLGLLGLVAAMVVVVLVPVVLGLDLVLQNPQEAYNLPKFRVLLTASAITLVAVLGILVLGGRPVGVPMLVPVLALLGVSALSAAFSDDPYYTLFGDRNEGLLSLAAGVLLFYALARSLTSWTRVRLFLAAGVTAAVAVSIHGIAQNFGVDLISGWSRPPFSDLGRPFSTTGNALTLAAYLTLMMGAGAALCLGVISKVGRGVWLAALVLIGACWISTEARGALLATGVALPAVLWAARYKMGTIRPLLTPLAAALLGMITMVAASTALGFSTLSVPIVAVLVAYLAFVAALAWITRSGSARSLILALAVVVAVGAAAIAAAFATGSISSFDAATGREGTQVSTAVRLLIWRDTTRMVLDRPLLGHGPDNFRSSFAPYVSEELEGAISTPDGDVQTVDRAHNDLLHTAATTGLLGLAAYLWLLFAYFRNVLRRGGWTLLAISGGVLAYVLQLQTAFPSLASIVAFWGLLGASSAVMRLRDHEGSEQQGSPEQPRKGVHELLVAVAVVLALSTAAVPAFLEQRHKAAEAERDSLDLYVTGAASLYERAERRGVEYPEAGSYSRGKPLQSTVSSARLRPPPGVTITTTTPPSGGFTVEGTSVTLGGTFRYAYDSNTGEYSTLGN